MRIGDAAAALGLATHVLRHWEDMRVLVPPRAPSGHRVYDDELVAQARVVVKCQRAGLSLQEIATLLHGGRDDRVRIIATHRERIIQDIRTLSQTEDFLTHVLTCQHPLVTECPGCTHFATRG